MKRVILCSLLSCMLVGQMFADTGTVLATTILPTVAGAVAGGLCTAAKARYGHWKYGTYHTNTHFENTLSHGAVLAGQYTNGGLTNHQPYMNPIAFNMLDVATVSAVLGSLYGFYKNGFMDGCKITLGSAAMVAATYKGTQLLHQYLDTTYTPMQGPRATHFTYPFQNN